MQYAEIVTLIFFQRVENLDAFTRCRRTWNAATYCTPTLEVCLYFRNVWSLYSRSQWPRGLRRSSAAARLLRLWVRIPPRAWMSVCCECCVLSSRGLCDELIARLEESYRLWCVVVYDLETSWMRRPWPTGGCYAKNKHDHYIISVSRALCMGCESYCWVFVVIWFQWKRNEK